ncbi:hypothetical protein [Paenibacillus sp.]|jgi:hypothetical protein|uniref:hypothetical protein n=1 Tax=Paenibacillus sp. TaxID=58172 RepID=UPI002816E7D1|nr:hypothetical protein [Paenibacillus sp.]MDR0266573.1 hypothetical protein [Paenibacillus sp.]
MDNPKFIYTLSKSGQLFRLQKEGSSIQVPISGKGAITQVLTASNDLYLLMIGRRDEYYEKTLLLGVALLAAFITFGFD